MEDAMRGMGRFIRMRREALKMNQGELGAAIGRDQGFISELERGVPTNLPSIEILRGLAAELDCDVADFLIAAEYIDADYDARMRALEESATRYEVSRQLTTVQRELQTALDMITRAIQERGPHIVRDP
jgi:transcriptional regulator with XRE-family HTH domain